MFNCPHAEQMREGDVLCKRLGFTFNYSEIMGDNVQILITENKAAKCINYDKIIVYRELLSL